MQPVSAEKKGEELKYRVLMGLILLLGFALRVYALDEVSLIGDEVITLTNFVSKPIPYIVTHFHTNNHIFASVLARLSASLGENLFMLRWPSALLGVLGVLITYKLASRLFSEREGLIAAFLLSIAPRHVEHSQQVRGYAGAIFFSALSVYLLYRALQTNRRRYWLGFAVATILNIYTHLFGTLLAVVEVLVIAAWLGLEFRGASPENMDGLRARAKYAARALAGSLLVLGLLFLPLFHNIVSIPEEERIYEGDFRLSSPSSTTLSLMRPMNSFVKTFMEEFTPGQKNDLILFTTAALLGLGASLRRQRRPALILLAWVLLPFFMVVAGELIAEEYFFARRKFLAFIFPAYMIFVARGIAAISFEWVGLLKYSRAAWRLATGVCLTLTIGLYGLPSAAGLVTYYVEPLSHNWSAVAHYLESQAKPDDVIVCEEYGRPWRGTQDTAQRCLWDLSFKLAHPLNPQILVSGIEKVAQYQAIVSHQALAKRPAKMWIVIWQEDYIDALSRGELAVSAPHRRFGTTTLIEAGSHDTLLDNLIEGAKALIEASVGTQAEFVYDLSLAQLYTLRGQREQAQAAFQDAQRAQSNVDREAQAYVESVQSILNLPAIAVRPDNLLEVNLDNQIELVGYGLDPMVVAPGNPIRLSLFWKALKPISENYTIFVHLRDATNTTVAQQDFQPFDGTYPTSQWDANEMVGESRVFALPPTLPSGAYTVHVGMYRLATLERLPVVGDETGDNSITLVRLNVTGD